jgi:hypothetical protein
MKLPSSDGTVLAICSWTFSFFAFHTRWHGACKQLCDKSGFLLAYSCLVACKYLSSCEFFSQNNLLIQTSVCVVSVLRITSFGFSTLDNVTYVSVIPSTWSSIEQSVGIICACLPTLRPLLRLLYGSSVNSIRKRDSASSNFPPRGPLSGKQSQNDEENSLDSLPSPTSPTPLTSQVSPQHMRQPSLQEMDTVEETLEELDGESETHIPRPESFA